MEMVLVAIISCLVAGALSAYGVWRRWSKRVEEITSVVGGKDQEIVSLRLKVSELEIRAAEREQSVAEKFKLFEETQQLNDDRKQELTERFKGLTDTVLSEALERSQKMISDLAGEAFKKQSEAASTDLGSRYQQIASLLTPLTEAVTKIQASSESTSESLAKQLKNLVESQQMLAVASSNLKSALTTPKLVGPIGEETLERLLRWAGFVEGAQYEVKPRLHHPERNEFIAPDIVLKLGDGTGLAIDAKMPMTSYISSVEAPTEKERADYIDAHVEALKTHVRDLSNSGYDRAIKSYGFTILFCANEGAFLSAIHADPDLHSYALQKRILLASPTTLLFILKWLSHQMQSAEAMENVREITEAAVALNAAIPAFIKEYNLVGVSLRNTVKAFNESLTTLDERVTVHGKEIESLGVPFGKKPKQIKKIRAKIQSLTEGADHEKTL